MTARDRIKDWPHDLEANPAPPSGGRYITNVVLMGMGEPLYNFDNVKDAMEIVSDGEGISLSKRRITLSTSGVVPEIAARGRGDRHHAGDLAARHDGRDPRPAGAAQQEISDQGTARRLPQLSGPVQRAAHHLRICDAEGRE